MSSSQEKVFREREGNAWFSRNRSRLGQNVLDWPTRLVAKLDGRARMQDVAEFGCANGWRLNDLRSLFGPECRFHGIDASEMAIAAGTMTYPDLDLRTAALSSVPFRKPFDLVIVSFVLHWVDRDLLATCVKEIDRLIKPGGYLVLSDFLPDRSTRRPYHHLPDDGVYTYKQDYTRIFTALGFYEEVKRVTFSHENPELISGAETLEIDPNDRAVASVLLKSLETYDK